MGRSFWPILLIVAALGAATIWTKTPLVVGKLPDGLRGTMRHYVRTAMGLPQLAEQAIKGREETPDLPLLGGGTLPGEAGRQPEALPPAAAAAVPAPLPATRPGAEHPSVRPTSVAAADWCVLTCTTPVETLDDKPLASISGGRFFLIERRARTPKGGTTLIGNFTPKRLSQTVQLNSRFVLCLSGSPDDLTTAQLHAFRMYYQLRSEALDYLEELRKSAGDVASPVYKRLQEAERIYEFRKKELAGMSTLAGDQRAVEREELDKLELKAESLRAEHDAWKRAHKAEVSDPTRDPHYRELVGEYRRYAAQLPAGCALE